MDALTGRRVQLPDGKTVTVSDDPVTWWIEDGASGYINPRLLAPDPKQPREHMNDSELAELAQSVGERGVRDPITVTPLSLSPWIEVSEGDKNLPFVIVSGHRRTRSALLSGVVAVPIRVVVYATKQDYLLDASVLNKDRADLSPLEEGREMLRLSDNDVTQERIGKSLGKSIAYVRGRIALTQLHPALQRLLDPALPKTQRLPVTYASDLGGIEGPTVEELEELLVVYKTDIQSSPLQGKALPTFNVSDLEPDELRFELQKVLLSVILRRDLSAARATELIQEHKLKQREARGKSQDTQRFKPSKRKEVMDNLAASVMASTVVDWTPHEFERIFENSKWDEVNGFRQKLNEAGQNLVDISRLLQRICDKKAKEMGSKR